ncbi:hypothetical protein [Phaeospirillum tilakii]|uniref:Uncharacterized protein n=1 Tax=Phaeospirillum tilakii TaxID=741673 RepID=A0ABW5CES1_9PROT
MSSTRDKILFISREKAESLLISVGLRIGGWNQLAEMDGVLSRHIQFHPGRGQSELYVLARHLSKWVARNGWVLIHFDNSTLPLDVEIDTVSFIFLAPGERWDITRQRIILVDSGDAANNHEAVSLMIFFGLMFEWHFYLAGEHAEPGRRLGILDGTVYFFGQTDALAEAGELIEQVTHTPLTLPDGYYTARPLT